MSNTIRIYFKHFSIGQDLSPMPYQQRATRALLTQWSKNIRPQLVRVEPFRGGDFPIKIHVKYFVNKESFDINEFSLKTYWLLRLLEQMTIIQSINNSFVKSVRYSVKEVIDPSKEGCEIEIFKNSENAL